MKNIQISEALFIKLIRYHFSFEYTDDDYYAWSELEEDIKKSFNTSLTKYCCGVTTRNTRRQKRSKSVRKHAKNILMKKECRKVFGGDFFVRDIYRNVAHSCGGNEERITVCIEQSEIHFSGS